MARSPGPERSTQRLLHRESRGHWALPWSAALHGLIFGLAGWATSGAHQQHHQLASQHPTRAYALHYLLLERPSDPAAPVADHRSAVRLVPPPAADPELPIAMPAVPDLGRGPHQPAIPDEELSPDAMAAIGVVLSARQRSGAVPGGGHGPKQGSGSPATGEAPAVARGLDRGIELVSGVGSACPELRRPAWANREVAVSVGFVVDTNGRVDSETLRVIRSPGRPQGDHPVYSHIYTVAASARDDPDRLGPAAYDSLVSRDVTDHVADLLFRPALREGQAIRSTVLVSCQTI